MYSRKINDQLSLKRIAGIMFLIIFSLLIAGCTDKGTAENKDSVEAPESIDKNKAAIQTVVEKEFTGPDEEFRKLRDAAMEAQNDVTDQAEFDALQETPVWQNYLAYMEETYASYFTENGYDNFLMSTPAFMYSVGDGDFILSVSDINIHQNDKEPTMYNFTFQVEYANEKGETEIYNFEGESIVPDEGKIGKIHFLDKDGLRQKMNEDSN